MSRFMPEPKLILNGKEELLDALNNPVWYKDSDLRWSIKSDFLCDCIQEIHDSGKYAYNADVNRLATEKLGLPAHDYNVEGTPLSALVYNAQNYKDSDDLLKAGYAPLTQEMVDLAYKCKSKIEFVGSNLLGFDVKAVYNVRRIGDRNYVMKPHARNYAIRIDGQPAKIVK